jgi:hypothetical protein
MQVDRLKPLEVWEPRCHGEWLNRGIFVICSRDGGDLITMQPPSVGSNPWQVYERLLHDDKTISVPFAGGRFSLTEFDFTIIRLQLELVPELFLRVFASPQTGPSHWFNRYRPARILIRSEPTEWGTIDDVLRPHGDPLDEG